MSLRNALLAGIEIQLETYKENSERKGEGARQRVSVNTHAKGQPSAWLESVITVANMNVANGDPQFTIADAMSELRSLPKSEFVVENTPKGGLSISKVGAKKAVAANNPNSRNSKVAAIAAALLARLNAQAQSA